MRLLAIFILLIPALCHAQDITKDSSFVELINGKYFQTRVIERENGNRETSTNLIGDGSAQAVFNVTLYYIKQSASVYAESAVSASEIPKGVTELIRQNAALKQAFGKSPIDTIQAADIAAYLVPGWTIKTKSTGTVQDVVFSVTAGGQMRHNLGQTPRNVTYIGSVMRLHNFPSSGANTDFFKNKNGNFVSLSSEYIIRKPGSNQTFKNKKSKG